MGCRELIRSGITAEANVQYLKSRGKESLGASRTAKVQAKDQLENMEKLVYEREGIFKTDGKLQRHYGK